MHFLPLLTHEKKQFLHADGPREAIADCTALSKSATSSNCRPRRIFFGVKNKMKSQGGQTRAVRRLIKHFNGPCVDLFLSCRSPMARRIVIMKQHGRQQGRSFLPHGSKEVSVQYLLVRNVNHRKRSTKRGIDCLHTSIIIILTQCFLSFFRRF